MRVQNIESPLSEVRPKGTGILRKHQGIRRRRDSLLADAGSKLELAVHIYFSIRNDRGGNPSGDLRHHAEGRRSGLARWDGVEVLVRIALDRDIY